MHSCNFILALPCSLHPAMCSQSTIACISDVTCLMWGHCESSTCSAMHSLNRTTCHVSRQDQHGPGLFYHLTHRVLCKFCAHPAGPPYTFPSSTQSGFMSCEVKMNKSRQGRAAPVCRTAAPGPSHHPRLRMRQWTRQWPEALSCQPSLSPQQIEKGSQIR